MTFAKQRTEAHDFDMWPMNGVPFDMEKMKVMFHYYGFMALFDCV